MSKAFIFALALSFIASAGLADEPTTAPTAGPTTPQASPQTSPSPGAPSDIHWKKIVLADGFYSEGAAFGDFNHDGQMDVVAGGTWYEGPDFVKKHVFADYPKTDPHGYSNQFLTFTHSFKHDGWDDIIVVSWPGKETTWYENPRTTGEAMWKRHVVFNETDDESPVFCDLFKNGKPVLVCGSQGTNKDGGEIGYAQPDDTDPAKPWVWHPVSERSKRYFRYLHGLGVGDVNADGRNDILIPDGWFQQPLDPTGDQPWTFHPAKFYEDGRGDGCSQMYVYDVNGDGRPDVIAALQAHGYGIAWFEQNADGTFTKHLILGRKASDNPYGVLFSEPHAMFLMDLNNDGLPDLITGKRWWAHGPHGDVDANGPAVLYWFELQRNPDHSVAWIPHLIDDHSGVGTQVTACDIHNDHHPPILVGNKRGTFLFVQQPAVR